MTARLTFCVAAIAAAVCTIFGAAPASAQMMDSINWTGFYAGGNLGAAIAPDNIHNTGTDTGGGGLGSALNNGAIPGTIGASSTNLMGGLQAGYNRQFLPNWVWGVEGDFDLINGNTTTASLFPGGGGSVPLATVYGRSQEWLGTLRGRIGFTPTPPLLLYATGGLAVGESKISSAFLCPTCFPPTSSVPGTSQTSTSISAGWTVGAGAEWMFARQWSVRLEYLYVNLGSHSSNLSYTYGPTSTLKSTVLDEDHIVRAAINYHF